MKTLICACGCGQPIPEGEAYRRGHQGARARPKDGYTVRDMGHESPCWIAHGRVEGSGYVNRRRGGGVRTTAHRLAWIEARGEIPSGMQVHHLCGQRACIRIDHLELATPAENMRKGANVKLDVEKVRAIRADPRVARAVAAEYGVSAHTIRAVRNPKRRMWMDA